MSGVHCVDSTPGGESVSPGGVDEAIWKAKSIDLLLTELQTSVQYL